MAIFHLHHSSIGRSTHAAGTAGAHLAYIARTAACSELLGEHMPVPELGSRAAEARAWLNEAEAGDRKNARVIDKLTVALPLELDTAECVQLVRDYMAALTKGQVPWLAAIHDTDKDADNPHAHLVIRDRDPVTGKRVLGMSEKGSTEWARDVWEQTCNAALAAAGREERIDRRTLEAQGLERPPQQHIGPQALQIEERSPGESWKLAALEVEALSLGEALTAPVAVLGGPVEAQHAPKPTDEHQSLWDSVLEAVQAANPKRAKLADYGWQLASDPEVRETLSKLDRSILRADLPEDANDWTANDAMEAKLACFTAAGLNEESARASLERRTAEQKAAQERVEHAAEVSDVAASAWNDWCQRHPLLMRIGFGTSLRDAAEKAEMVRVWHVGVFEDVSKVAARERAEVVAAEPFWRMGKAFEALQFETAEVTERLSHIEGTHEYAVRLEQERVREHELKHGYGLSL